MTRLWRRAARLVAGPVEVLSGLELGEDRAGGLQVGFRVRRSLERAANTAEVTVTNLSELTRERLVETQALFLERGGRMPLALEAGYEERLGVLYRGEVERVSVERAGTEVLTRLESADGLSALTAEATLSFGPGVRIEQVMQSLGDQIGVRVEGALQAVRKQGVQAGLDQLFSGAALTGSASTILRQLGSALQVDLTIDGGELIGLAPGESRGGTAPLLSPETGLLDSPRRVYDPSRPRAVLVEARALLNDQLLPGGLVRIESLDLAGTYRIRTVEHEGETDGSDWSSTVEGEAV